MNITDVAELSPDETLNIALDTIKIGKQAIIFASSKASCEKTAREIANYLKKHDLNGKKTELHEELSQKILSVLSHPTSQCEKLSDAAKYGIAFHHSGLAYQQREIIENAFRDGTIKIIVATPTLAAGVSMPAFRTILKDLKRFSGYGMNYIPVLEYMQQSGRAGRPEYDTFGEAIMIAKSDKEKDILYDKYVCGAPEEITSKLAVEPILRTYVLSLIATNFVKTKPELLDFFKDTFWAHQFGDFYYLSQRINSVLNDLIGYGFVEVVNEKDSHIKKEMHIKKENTITKHGDFISATALSKKENNEEQLRSTLIGTRVSELYIDPDSANQIIVSLKKAKAYEKETSTQKNTSDFAYLFMLCQTNELKPRSNLSNKDFELMQEELLKKDDGEDDGGFITNKISQDDDLYYDYLNAFKGAFIIDLWCNEFGEDFLFEKYNIRPGELNEKISRLDWLIYGASELAKLSGKKELITPLNRLRTRVSYGVKEELLPLLQIKGIGRARARKLFNNKLHNIGDLKKIDESVLAHILGAKTAQNIKKQLGQDVKELTKEIRKDTNNLNSFF